MSIFFIRHRHNIFILIELIDMLRIAAMFRHYRDFFDLRTFDFNVHARGKVLRPLPCFKFLCKYIFDPSNCLNAATLPINPLYTLCHLLSNLIKHQRIPFKCIRI